MGWGVGRAPGMVVYSLLGCVVALKKVMEFMVMFFFVREALYNYLDCLRPLAGFTLFLYPFLTPLNA